MTNLYPSPVVDDFDQFQELFWLLLIVVTKILAHTVRNCLWADRTIIAWALGIWNKDKNDEFSQFLFVMRFSCSSVLWRISPWSEKAPLVLAYRLSNSQKRLLIFVFIFFSVDRAFPPPPKNFNMNKHVWYVNIHIDIEWLQNIASKLLQKIQLIDISHFLHFSLLRLLTIEINQIHPKLSQSTPFCTLT